MDVRTDESSGAVTISDGDRPVLTYRYGTVEPPAGYLDRVRPSARKYARPRSDYIHPLYGPHGEELTADWPPALPHHRGIYWAWPEVEYNGQRGDLHALQRVFARPTGHIETRADANVAEITAENRWMWEDETPIVRERVTIRAYPADKNGRNVDLTLRFTALEDGITLARRNTKRYGGLNMRLAPIEGMKLSHSRKPAADESAGPAAWQLATGTWSPSDEPTTLVVFEDARNPGYPGDFVKYPKLPWFQPTFPKAGTRYELKPDAPLLLRYRLWIIDGPAPDAATCLERFRGYQSHLMSKDR